VSPQPLGLLGPARRISEVQRLQDIEPGRQLAVAAEQRDQASVDAADVDGEQLGDHGHAIRGVRERHDDDGEPAGDDPALDLDDVERPGRERAEEQDALGSQADRGQQVPADEWLVRICVNDEQVVVERHRAPSASDR